MANVHCQLLELASQVSKRSLVLKMSLLHFWWDIKKRVNVIFQIYLNIFPGQLIPPTLDLS